MLGIFIAACANGVFNAITIWELRRGSYFHAILHILNAVVNSFFGMSYSQDELLDYKLKLKNKFIRESGL